MKLAPEAKADRNARIRQLHLEGLSWRAICKTSNVSMSTVSRAVKQWKRKRVPVVTYKPHEVTRANQEPFSGPQTQCSKCGELAKAWVGEPGEKCWACGVREYAERRRQ